MKSDISSRLLKWYFEHKRDLPWRNTSNPYLIWISEIILQQTRVEQGLPYFERFSDRFPDVGLLAAASEDDVLREWQGLGYYSRARNLHQAAQTVVNDHGGKIPDSYNGLLKLKGIGDYTAAAISSFAFGEAKPVIDGNVIRVISRIFGIEEPVQSKEGSQLIRKHANTILDVHQPGLHNQAIMEFGALHCVPVNPQCDACIFNDCCIAQRLQKVDKLPVKNKAAKQKVRYFNFFRIVNGTQFLIQKRKADDIWKGLYEMPMIEGKFENETVLFTGRDWKSMFPDLTFKLKNISCPVKHILSHQILYATFFELSVKKSDYKKLSASYISVEESMIDKVAFSVLLSNYFKKNFK